MACWSNQAWITSALNNEAVTQALVLAQSIRRTCTMRKIAVITCTQVSTEKRRILRQAFDTVLLMDESCFPRNIGKDEVNNVHAKIYAFSLTTFQKCVYISANCMLLENCDKLFDTASNMEVLTNLKDGSMDLSIFGFTPSKEIWTQICKSMGNNGLRISNNFLSTWLKNQAAVLRMGTLKTENVARFCISTGKLFSDQTHAPIIQFVGANVTTKHVKCLKKLNMGLHEKLIADHWLKLYEETVDIHKKGLIPPENPEYFSRFTSEPIAIVGMSCRYPGANTLEEFWNMLYSGEEGVREPPAFRWTKEHSLRVLAEDRKTTAGFLSVPVDEFDAGFFGVSPKEAQYMDPQARLLHEVMWESLEDAGIDPLSLYGTHAGIFTGSWMQDYKDIVQGSAEKDFFRTYMGNSIGAAAARLSRFLGLTGPSIATESGCSSAIVALDLAVKSLRNGETSLALAGGVNLLLHPFTSSMMEYVISPDGRCKTFDAKADGFGRAEGCGVLVLKRLGDAMRDRDNIWAMIRGSATCQEGVSRSLGRPTVQCEALAMQLALEDANVAPEQVSFVETHGTGTQVGDPMEVAAIAKAYYSPYRKEPLVIGSVKTNVGHTESCSGITGIMKAVLALQHEVIPKHRNLETLNPEIFLDSIPAVIPMKNLPWPKVKGQPRVCGASSFGITGTDGHVILEEAPDYKPTRFNFGMERPVHLLTISGKTKESLEKLLEEYQKKISGQTENFADLAYSANMGRASFNNRAFIVATNCENAGAILKHQNFLKGEVKDGQNDGICFLFTGQGSQYQGMAKMLYETSPIFRVSFDTCERMLVENYNLSISQVLWGSDPSLNELSRTIYSQTSIFCVEYCLFKLWQSWGIKPDYVLGHSLGEFCAAVAAGVLTFEDALKLVVERSQLIDNLPRGSMLVIKASKPEVEKWMKAAKINLDFAAVNSSEQTVVSGDTKTVERFLVYLKGQGTKAIILEATHAFHSRHMDPMLEEYRKVAQSIKCKQENPNIQYVSGMEGRVIEDVSEINADYWVRHTREKVSFIDACAVLRDLGCQDFVEVGPQPVLSSFMMMNNEGASLNCLPSLRRGTNDWETILTSLGKLYLLGYQVDWKGYDEPYIRKRVSLPFHPFNRRSFWVECTTKNAPIIHPLLGSQFGNASALNIFQNGLLPKSVPYLKDHCIGNRIIFPGAGFTEMCLSAGFCVANGLFEHLECPSRPLRLENLKIDAPLELKEDKLCHLQAIVTLPEDTQVTSGFQVKIFHQSTTSSDNSGKWLLHASSNFIPVASTKAYMSLWNPARIPEIISKTEATSPENFYKRVDDAGLKFGLAFRTIRRFWAVPQQNCKTPCDEIVVEMELPPDTHKYLLHPLLIDAALQAGILTEHQYVATKLKVPVRIGGLTLINPLNTEDLQLPKLLYLHAWKENESHVIFVSTADQLPVAFLEQIEMLDTNVSTIESVLELQNNPLPDCWEETWKVIPSHFGTQMPQISTEDLFSDCDFFQKSAALGQNTSRDLTNHQKNKRLILLYILNACQELGWKPEVGETLDVESFCHSLRILPNFRKLVRFYFTVFQEDTGLLKQNGDTTWVVQRKPPENGKVFQEIDRLASELKAEQEFAEVTLIHENIAKNLSKILTGRKSALQMLFPEKEEESRFSVDVYYRQHPSRSKMFAMMNLVLTSIFNNVGGPKDSSGEKRIYRVLEVGAGVGSISGIILGHLKAYFGSNFEFYYTDISPAFFAKAEQKLEEFRENVKFEVFNIEQGPLGQGIPLGYFDMVCATDVLHATRDLEESLGYLRQTLRPGGLLCFAETVVPARDITFVFGLLEGYWRFEDLEIRAHHCCVGEQVWGRVMRQTGFKNFRSFKAYCDQFAVLVGVADPEVKTGCVVPGKHLESRGTWVVFADNGNTEMWSRLATVLEASGDKVVLALKPGGKKVFREVASGQVLLEEIGVEEEVNAVLKIGGVQGVVYGWGMNQNETDQKHVALPFLHIAKTLVALDRPPKLFVVTQGVQALTEDTVTSHPTPATLMGMAKSLKNERFDLFVRCVDLEQGASVEEHLNQVVFELAMFRGQKEQNRVQVAYRGGHRYEPRLERARVLKKSDELRLPPSTDRYHLKLPESRAIQDLGFEPLEVESVGETEVEIRTKAYSLNFKDILTILKPTKEFEELKAVGLDFAGVVTKAGEKARWKVGDRVFALNYKDEQLPSHLIVESNAVNKIPDKMTYWEAATLPAVFSTAYHCLINIAKMKKGDKVLIHTGSGGVGLTAIQVAKMVGAEIITTAGTPRKRAYLRSLGIQHVFHSRDTSFEKDILRVTNGQGVDVVLNSITGPGIKEATLRATAKNGRFVEMSKLNVWTSEEVKVLRPDVEYNIVDLTKVDPKIQMALMKRLHSSLEDGQLRAIPFVKFDALRIRQALQYFQKAKHIGKVVVTMPEVSTSQGQYQTEVPLLNSQSTYLITGGLGGIGFEVCKWMVKHGATDIALTGRRPPTPEIAEQIKSLAKKGVNIRVILGDIGNADQCQALIQEITREMKPLRGIMHCAGVIRDNLYPNQTWNAFEDTFNPKVNGTWNLHEFTKNLPLEHFVVYSSVTALVGTPGQPNHSAANCFEDAFIHYRHSLGLPGLSINWGQWAQVGCAKEVSVLSLIPVSVKRMLNGLEAALRQEKRQVAFADFASLSNLSAMCPIIKSYLDDRVLKQYAASSQGQPGSELIKANKFWEEVDAAPTKSEKMEVLSNYLKIILRSALRMESDERLSPTANLQELGVDSLMMIELKNSIQSLLGSRVNVTANMLKNCNTIQLISEAVVGKIMEEEDGGDEEVVPLEPMDSKELLELLKTDAQLPEIVRVAPEATLAVKPSQIKTVLVTGATGQLGPYVIAELCRSYPEVENIICLVMGDQSGALERVKDTVKQVELLEKVDFEKIEGVAGNVAMEDLGITREKYKDLCKTVDAVIHCAAKTHLSEHLRPGNRKLTDCRSVNISGTVNILQFACTEKVKHVFYASTLLSGIFGESKADTLPDNWPDVDIIQTIVDNKFPGMQTSKWICEILMEQANQRGIPCKVFRFPWIAGESQTGRVSVLSNLYILRFLGFLKMGAMPDIVIPAEVLPVDICAEMALQLFMNDQAPNEIFNLAHPQPQVEQEFVDVANREFGKTLKILNWETFAEQVDNGSKQEMGDMKDLYRDQKMLSSHFADAIEFLTKYTVAPLTYFGNEKVNKLIENYGKGFPSSMETVARDLKFVKSSGLMEKLGILNNS